MAQYVTLAMLQAMNLGVSPDGSVETKGGYRVGTQVDENEFEISSALEDYVDLCSEEFDLGSAVAGLL